MSALATLLVNSIRTGLTIQFNNEGYNNLMIRVVDPYAYSSDNNLKQTSLPNDHLTEEKLSTYLAMMVKDLIDAREKAKEEKTDRKLASGEFTDGLDDVMRIPVCRQYGRPLETCLCPDSLPDY